MAGRGRGMTLPAWMTSGEGAAVSAQTIMNAERTTEAQRNIEAPQSSGSSFGNSIVSGNFPPNIPSKGGPNNISINPSPHSSFATSQVQQQQPFAQQNVPPNYQSPLPVQQNSFIRPPPQVQPFVAGTLPYAPTLQMGPSSQQQFPQQPHIGIGNSVGNMFPPPIPSMSFPYGLSNQSLPTRSMVPMAPPMGQMAPMGNFPMQMPGNALPAFPFAPMPGRGPPPAFPRPLAPFMSHQGPPGAFAPPRGPPGPGPGPGPSSSGAAVVGDPNNDVASWSEHESEDKRKYWFNRVTGASTYEKPFCLKTPEERSIPPCPWKEYTAADGKKYYSDGKESSWSMPEDFRLWKERIEAIERKRSAPATAAAAPSVEPAPSASAAVATAPSQLPGIATSARTTSQTQSRRQATAQGAGSDDDEATVLAYSTREEAMDAFKALLAEKKVPTSMRFKEVMDLCQDDVRFNALKSAGEKKQALAEYQTKKLKQEKEVQKNKARKCRDAFLLMLAENTEIDARTRWRDAIELLQDDSRFKNVEDAHDREDLFNDFVLELEKKEREDRTKQRDAALQKVGTILETLATDGTITRKSSWVDSRKEVLDRLSGSEFRSLEDVDVKRTFQDYVGRLDAQYKDEEKRRKEYLQRKVDKLATAFKEAVEQLLFVGVVRSNSRWKDSVLKEEVSQSKDYTALVEALETPLSGDFLPSVPGLGSLPSTAAALGITITARDVFEKAVTAAREAYRSDKRLVKDVLEDSAFGFTYQTTPAQFKMAIFSAAGLRTQAERDGTLLAGDPGAVSRAVHQLLTEDGEEIEDGYMEAGASRSKILAAKQLRSMLMKRPAALDQVFSDMQEEAQAEREEALRRQRKKEERYVELLEEYFYRSDHVGVGWEEAKHLLERHSAYAALAKPDRSRVFAEYMEQLARKMEAKTKSMRTLLSSAATSSNGEKADAEENVGVSESSAGNNAREASASVSAPAPMEAGGAAMGPVAAPPAGVGVGGSDDPSGPPAIESSALAKEKKRSRTDRHSDADRGALENENDVDDDEEEEEEEGDDDTKDKKSKKHKKDKRSKKHKR